MNERNNPYADILHVKRPDLINHERASKESRASQFGAFRALTGHEDAVREVARVTDDALSVSEQFGEGMNRKITILQGRITEKPTVTITYYEPDERKTGVNYKTVTGYVKKIDDFEKVILMSDGSRISINAIVDCRGSIFGE